MRNTISFIILLLFFFYKTVSQSFCGCFSLKKLVTFCAFLCPASLLLIHYSIIAPLPLLPLTLSISPPSLPYPGVPASHAAAVASALGWHQEQRDEPHRTQLPSVEWCDWYPAMLKLLATLLPGMCFQAHPAQREPRLSTVIRAP